ncbi:Stk1 family PASTA domain-containing Ser/Thr kinase [Devriesea agamarum]|uniref:Stk1 family PASTA domain-containing Ser/Thr kinase n=1 Tax=Devriesea agamarum TaxID=472569 RepID=UPI00071D76A6|nr:PASTA domain-containing protein [Devriesea agamarum]
MTSTSLRDPLIGRLLDGRYRVDRLIARGGMATVYCGTDERLERVVALKVMHPHLALDGEFLGRFTREARAAAKLSHPHVVAVHDQGEDDGVTYLAMEYVTGTTLRDHLRAYQCLTVRETLDITLDVLDALSAAHQAGIVHRDIKPENVLISASGLTKVADFGLARAIGTSTSSASGTLLGTVAYIAPEVVTNGKADERSDLYALGIMTYEMLTGRQPFTGDLPVQVAFQHVHDDVPPPSRAVATVPPALDSLVAWCTARDPRHRPESALTLLQSIREIKAGLSAEELNAQPVPLTSDSTGPMPTQTARLDGVLSEIPDEPRNGASANDFGVGRPQHGHFVAAQNRSGFDGMAVVPVPNQDAANGSSQPRDISLAELFDDVDQGDHRGEDGGAGDHDAVSAAPKQGGSKRAISGIVLAPVRRRMGSRTRPRGPVKIAITIVCVLVLLAAAAWAGVWWYQEKGPGAMRIVPNTVGVSLSDAEARLAAVDLETRTNEQFSDSVPAGHVISSDPASGSDRPKGSTVLLNISKGQQLFAIPDIVNKPKDEARSAIEQAGLVFSLSDEQWSETVPAGAVISQTPSGASVPRGTSISVVVSKGPEPIQVVNQAGRSLADARTALEDKGFKVTTSEAFSSTVAKGSVVSQSPSGGTLHRGQEVKLVISKGPDYVQVPNVVRSSQQDATAALQAAGFKVAVESPNGAPILNLVYSQSVAGGQQAIRGSTITIKVI